MSTTELWVNVTTDDGNVHHSTVRIADGVWSPFSLIPSLNGLGFLNQSVTASAGSSAATVDDSISSELRFSSKTRTGWTPALSVATGIGLASGNNGPFSGSELLGLGAPETPGWSFGLPMFLINSDGTRVDKIGDAAAHLDLGDLDPDDLPVSLDFWDTFSSGGSFRGFFLCLATESGGLYFADIPSSGKGRITNLKTTMAGDPGNVISVACTGNEVCVVNDAGKIGHTTRRRDGTWLPFGDVNAATRSTETFRQISILFTEEFGRTRTGMHLLGVTASGGLLHTYRTLDDSPDPLWSLFSDAKAQAGNPGFVTSVGVSGNNPPD